MKVKVDDVKFIKDLYPRRGLDNETVNLYLLNLDALPPILVAKDLTLIDGYHRLTAYKVAGRTEIEADVLDIPEGQVLVEAAKRNAIHGKQLTREEKRGLAVKLYGALAQEEIAEILAVDQSTVSKWLSKLEEEKRKEQERQIIDLYLRCHTQQEIANKIGLTQGRIAQIINNMKIHIERETLMPSKLMLYDVWSFQRCLGSLEYPGRIPGEIVENVLYYWSKPFDVVVDPMAGGGVTIDACKRMYRRYRAYDIRPVREDIGKWDIAQGYPEEARGCDVVFLDPPYYKKKAEEYSPSSASSLDREGFLGFLEKLAGDTYKVLRRDGVTALIFGDYIDYEDDAGSIFSEGLYEVFKDAGFRLIMKVQVPLSSEQWSPSMVEWAKENKKLLSIARTLYIFKK